jgi:cytochrome c oxidase subunit 2
VPLEDGNSVEADESYFRESVLNPRAKVVAGFRPIMPTFQGQISEEQLLELIAYVRTLKAQPGEDPAEAPGEVKGGSR